MRHLVYVILSLAIVGCSHEQSHNGLLNKAEQMVFVKPDSVVRMLETCWGDTTLTAPDQALFGLLYTEALHRSGLSTGADSLICFSRNYYEQTGDQDHLARALLHHGIVLYKQQRTHEAVLTMKQAEHVAEPIDNHGFKWYLYSVLGDVNDNVGNYTQTLLYYKQALAAARQQGSDEWTVQTLNNIALTFDLLGETDSLRHYIEQAKPLAAKTDGEVRATYLVNLASHYLHLGKRRESKDCLLRVQNICPTDRGAKLLADIYLSEGDTASAVGQWYRLTNSFSPDVSIQSYRQPIRYLQLQGDTRRVAEYSQRLNEVYHSLYASSDAADVIGLQTRYDEQQNELRWYRTTILLLSGILLLTVAAVLIGWYSRRRIDRLNARFVESQQKYELTRKELTRMRRQKEREQRENSQHLKAVVSRLHSTADRGKAAAADDITTLTGLTYALSPTLQSLLSDLNTREQTVCLLTRHNFLPSEIATLTISTPQTITNTRVRLLKKLFGQTGGAKDFDSAIRKI